jgi:hypothetical protein
MSKTMQINDIHLKAEMYTELINDMQAKIMEFERDYPDCMSDELANVKSKLSEARMESRIRIDEAHFQKWESLLLAANVAMQQSPSGWPMDF